MWRRAFEFLKRNGLRMTLGRIIVWTQVFFKKNILLLANPDRADVFSKIYSTNYWASEESASGVGSELRQTENIRKALPRLFAKYKCRTIFDAPCGDFNWMQHVVADTSLKYIGGDIVPDLIQGNRQKFGNERISFNLLDICKDPLPKADIMMCRDCLFHLSYDDVRSFVTNFCKSDIPLLLVTTHKNEIEYFKNKNIRTGDFRFLDIFDSPLGFPRDVLDRFDDYHPPEPAREMCLFTNEQLQAIAE